MPNHPAIPLVSPRTESLDRMLPVHEHTARHARRQTEKPRVGTAAEAHTQAREQPSAADPLISHEVRT